MENTSGCSVRFKHDNRVSMTPHKSFHGSRKLRGIFSETAPDSPFHNLVHEMNLHTLAAFSIFGEATGAYILLPLLVSFTFTPD